MPRLLCRRLCDRDQLASQRDGPTKSNWCRSHKTGTMLAHPSLFIIECFDIGGHVARQAYPSDRLFNHAKHSQTSLWGSPKYRVGWSWQLFVDGIALYRRWFFPRKEAEETGVTLPYNKLRARVCEYDQRAIFSSCIRVKLHVPIRLQTQSKPILFQESLSFYNGRYLTPNRQAELPSSAYNLRCLEVLQETSLTTRLKLYDGLLADQANGGKRISGP
ncbi:hypothetical protein B0J18DRAFT_426866 [Chaetomium sp. MPI-SDFR-AT-0129]|nr:hypothetical protein B0J18DRAFT_426866 [Chaetomium sp. MPI-SDFR-AT-0129]